MNHFLKKNVRFGEKQPLKKPLFRQKLRKIHPKTEKWKKILQTTLKIYVTILIF